MIFFQWQLGSQLSHPIFRSWWFFLWDPYLQNVTNITGVFHRSNLKRLCNWWCLGVHEGHEGRSKRNSYTVTHSLCSCVPSMSLLHIYCIIFVMLLFLQDWKCIISMLLDQNPRTGSTTDEDSTNLVRLLFASIRKAVGEKIIPSTDNRKQYHSKAQRVRFCLCSFWEIFLLCRWYDVAKAVVHIPISLLFFFFKFLFLNYTMRDNCTKMDYCVPFLVFVTPVSFLIMKMVTLMFHCCE